MKAAFMERIKYWDTDLTSRWNATRILGSGTFGVCVLFEKRDDVDENDDNTPDRIVVKQSQRDMIEQLLIENRVLYELGRSNPLQ